MMGKLTRRGLNDDIHLDNAVPGWESNHSKPIFFTHFP